MAAIHGVSAEILAGISIHLLRPSPDQTIRLVTLYLLRQPPEGAPIADYAGMGPEVLEISREEFKARLKPFRGEIRGVLTRSYFVAGIGNASADEVLWAARLHPYRKRTSLAAEEVDRRYDGMRACLQEAIEKMREPMGDDIHLKPHRWKQSKVVMLPAAGEIIRRVGVGDSGGGIAQSGGSSASKYSTLAFSCAA